MESSGGEHFIRSKLNMFLVSSLILMVVLSAGNKVCSLKINKLVTRVINEILVVWLCWNLF